MSQRSFNVGGPCDPELHYMLPAAPRLQQARAAIERGAYFAIRARHRVGTSTSLRALARELTDEGRYAAVHLSMAAGADYEDDVGAAELEVLASWQAAAREQLPAELGPPAWAEGSPGEQILTALMAWSVRCPRPLVLLLDDLGALSELPALAVMRQLREGHGARPAGFPAAIGAVGSPTAGSRFMLETLELADLTLDEVRTLYAQYTRDTGQMFADEALARVYHWSQGQPWLVSLIGRRLTEVEVTYHGRVIEAEDVDTTVKYLVGRSDVYFGRLGERLREARVRAVVERTFGAARRPPAEADIRYVCDLGLCRFGRDGALEIGNPMLMDVARA
jgi:hypothetical protein